MDHSSEPRDGDAQSVFGEYDGPVTQIRMLVKDPGDHSS